MKYSIRFTAGELTGKEFALSQDRQLSIGRSKTSDVQLTAADVSGKHVMVRLSKANVVVVEVFSMHVTKHNGNALKMGDSVELAANDIVQIGAANIFSVVVSSESEALPVDDSDNFKTTIREAAPVPPPPAASAPQDEFRTIIRPAEPVAPPPMPQAQPKAAPAPKAKTSAPKAAPAPASAPQNQDAVPERTGGETVAIQTLLASDEELEKIKDSYQSKQRRKIGFWVIIVAFFLALAISLYVALKPEREEILSWPMDANGNFLNQYTVVVPYLAVSYPKLAFNQVSEGNGMLEVYSAIGKLRDVPLHIVATTLQSNDTLTKNRETAFQEWMKAQRDADPTLNFSNYQEFYFTSRNNGSGVPLNRVSYTRRVENEDYFGYAVFLRYEDTAHSIMIEVPLEAQWRSAAFFRTYLGNMVIFAGKRAEDYWEGTDDYKKNSSIEEDINEIKIYQKRKSPVYWEKIHYGLVSVLIKAKQKSDTANIDYAKSLLIALRAEQRDWYNSQKLAYQLAKKNENKDTMNTIQAMASSIFTPEFQSSDYRYELIKRKDWK